MTPWMELARKLSELDFIVSQAVDAHDRLLLAGVHAVPHHLQHLVGDEVLAGAVGLHDGLDQVLGQAPVVR